MKLQDVYLFQVTKDLHQGHPILNIWLRRGGVFYSVYSATELPLPAEWAR